MTATDVTRRMEAEDLAHGKELVQMILRDWDWMTWNELLADDVVLSLKLGEGGGFGAVGGNLQVVGREDAKCALRASTVTLEAGFGDHRNSQRIRCRPVGQLGSLLGEGNHRRFVATNRAIHGVQ